MKGQNRIPRIVELKSKAIIETLEVLLDMAKKGKVIGLIYGVKHEPFNHSIGVAGSYADMPVCGKRVADKISKVLEQRAEEMEVWD